MGISMKLATVVGRIGVSVELKLDSDSVLLETYVIIDVGI